MHLYPAVVLTVNLWTGDQQLGKPCTGPGDDTQLAEADKPRDAL